MQTRRQFVRRAGVAGVAAVLAPQAIASAGASPALRGGRFSSGVLSGDPSPRGITLLTRVFDVERAGSVELEVATDSDFRRVVARDAIRTSARLGHSVKARVNGLRPGQQYFYRFATATENSRVGRFRTAVPADSDEPVRFAFYSCQDFTHGFYNAHELMAREDIDFVVNLGDYIYAEVYHTRRDGTGVRDDRIGLSRTLAEYRAKYALYRTDESLRDLHARVPFVSVWDDHEVIDNYAGAEPDGGLLSRYSRRRRRDAYRAFFENMPHYPVASGGTRLYRTLPFGRAVELFVLDQRQYRADQPCNDAVAPPCAEWQNPRPMLGNAQKSWFKDRLRGSRAAWKIIANEVMMMPAKVNTSYFTYDPWHGYPAEREELLQHIKANAIKDVAFVTGDIHTFIAGDVRTQVGLGETVATEFVGGSITSSNFGESDLPIGNGGVLEGNDANPNTSPAVIEALRGFNPWVRDANFDRHGYGLVEATRRQLKVELKMVQTIKRRSTARAPGLSYTVQRGQTSLFA